MRILTRNILQVMTVAGLVFLTSCEKEDNNDDNNVAKKKETVKEVMEEEPRYSHMNEAVEESEQSDFFASANANITVFVATNQAFEDLFAQANVSSVTELEAQMGEEAFANMVLYHAVNGKFNFSDFGNGSVETYAESDGGARLTVFVENDNQARLLINGNDEAGASTTSTTTIEANNGTIIEINAVIEAQTHYENIEDAEEEEETSTFVEIMTTAEASTQAMLQDETTESTVLVAQDTEVESAFSIYLANILDVEDLNNLLDSSAKTSLFAQFNVSTTLELLAKVNLADILSASSITMAEVMAELEAEDRSEFINHFTFSGDLNLEAMAGGTTQIISEAAIAYDVTTNTQGNIVLTDFDGNELILEGQTAQSSNGSVYLIKEVK